jgi:hypothetical protein
LYNNSVNLLFLILFKFKKLFYRFKNLSIKKFILDLFKYF